MLYLSILDDGSLGGYDLHVKLSAIKWTLLENPSDFLQGIPIGLSQSHMHCILMISNLPDIS